MAQYSAEIKNRTKGALRPGAGTGHVCFVALLFFVITERAALYSGSAGQRVLNPICSIHILLGNVSRTYTV